ncbi:hypothetical protein FA95DRAFT_1679049 [Auriscalpium vulgare]|uniref:Uncharacterized protein n=1 Tax=Auriscalpium vulgare TaxID=40419 RepID=A0ACB8RU53_9AGAM|nr:hypothetical protein FA95DRAFT_1679049 [Auriscalpium vulgare]
MESFTRQTGDGTSEEVDWRDALRSRLSRIDNSSGHSSSGSLAKESALRHEESRIIAALQTVRARINALLPITRLPPEIIYRIILYHSQIDHPFVDDDTRWATIGWIRSTHVCRRWRQIALAHSALWSRIPLSLASTCIKAFFDRAMSAPLRFGPDEPWSQDAEDIVAQNIHRAQLVQLDWSEINAPRTSLLHRMRDPAPFLEDFEFQDGSRDERTLSSNFLGGFAPRLRRLNLESRSRLPWSSPLLVNLTSLALKTSIAPDNLPVLSEVLDALERMHALESLTLEHGLPRADVSSPEDRIIHLPHLTSLDLTGSSPDCNNLIRHLNIPANAKVTIRMRYVHESATDFRTFFPIMRACLGVTASVIPVAGLYIILSPQSTSLTLMGWNNLTEDQYSTGRRRLRNSNFHFTWNFREREEDNDDREIVGLRLIICDAFATGHLKRLHVKDMGWERQHWKDLAQRAPNIRTISPTLGSEYELCHALCEDFASVGPQGDFMFPHLTSLQLVENISNRIPELSGVLPAVLAARWARLQTLQRAADSAVPPGDISNP